MTTAVTLTTIQEQTNRQVARIRTFLRRVPTEFYVVEIAAILSVISTEWAYYHDVIVAYGDAESHLNIAKRVVDSLTPGFAQLGGVWPPIPHLLMVPFVKSDFLWRTGLAGSIVSGICFIVTCVTLYKIGTFLTHKKSVGLLAFLTFALNPNILYLQSTPMTELPLIAFFTLSGYFFIKFLHKDNEIVSLILAAFFGFCASLSRYDGWALVAMEAGIIGLLYIQHKKLWQKMKGQLLMFGTMAFFGIGLWLLWDKLILGDAFYFTNSQFSAKSQQMAWLSKGELPGYHNIVVSFLYYFVTSMSNVGVVVFFTALVGLLLYMRRGNKIDRLYVPLVMMVPFIFYVVSLFMGQAVIFIPSLTPSTFEWNLFNVRYGVMLVPVAAFFFAYVWGKTRAVGRSILAVLLVVQVLMFVIGYSPVISLQDGTTGLSHAKHPEAQSWFKDNYDGGLVLLDDYARTMSIIKTNLPMQDVIYIGNKPYWDEEMTQPEKYATWIIMQKDDDVWNHIYEQPQVQARLYKYFQKVYTSPDIIIFKRNPAVPEDTTASTSVASVQR